jgi:hypothetical protein
MNKVGRTGDTRICDRVPNGVADFAAERWTQSRNIPRQRSHPPTSEEKGSGQDGSEGRAPAWQPHTIFSDRCKGSPANFGCALKKLKCVFHLRDY